MAQKTKKLTDRAREVLDTLVEAVESLLRPPHLPVRVPVRRPRLHPKRSR